MDNKEFKCPGDCSKCTFRQNGCCSSQLSLFNNEMLKAILSKFSVIEDNQKMISERMDVMAGKLETLQADALMVDPMAQFGAAAQKVDSQEKTIKDE